MQLTRLKKEDDMKAKEAQREVTVLTQDDPWGDEDVATLAEALAPHEFVARHPTKHPRILILSWAMQKHSVVQILHRENFSVKIVKGMGALPFPPNFS